LHAASQTHSGAAYEQFRALRAKGKTQKEGCREKLAVACTTTQATVDARDPQRCAVASDCTH
jgi:hypothetical protein